MANIHHVGGGFGPVQDFGVVPLVKNLGTGSTPSVQETVKICGLIR